MPNRIPDRLAALAQAHFPQWKVEKQIGSGGYSRVYLAHGEAGQTAALKWIEYPEDAQGIAELRARGASEEAVQEHRHHTMALLEQEIQMQQKLREDAHIVRLYGSAVEQRAEGGFDLLILMELLQPLAAAVPQMTVGDVLRLGQDMCQALAACERERILHRDIKPENIFRTAEGSFKLGDFGVARRTVGEKTHSRRGTPLYMAPEVNRGDNAYDHRVDIYSLGLVLYELLNNQCPPFVEGQGQPITPPQEEASIKARLAGDPLPEPVQAPEDLGRIVLQACAFDAEDRYETAEEMLQALQAVNLGARAGEKLEGLQNRPAQQTVTPSMEEASGVTRRALPRNTLPLDEQAVKPAPPSREEEEPAPETGDGKLEKTVKGDDNPFEKIKQDKAKRRKMLMTVAAIVAVIAAVVAGILFINGSKQQMRALGWTQNGSLCRVSWQDGGAGPWQVTAVWDKDTVYSASTRSRSVDIRLLPGENYTVTVGEEAPLAVAMQPLAAYSGALRLQAGNLYSFVQQAGNSSPKLTRQSGISYTPRIGAEGESGFVIRLAYTGEEGKGAQALCLIQYGDVFAEYTETLTPSAQESYMRIALNDVLKRASVSGGTLLCKVIVDNQLWYEGSFDASRKD